MLFIDGVVTGVKIKLVPYTVRKCFKTEGLIFLADFTEKISNFFS